MTVDVSRIRREFPIFEQQPAPFHYLDSAATAQICEPAAEALWRYETTARANVKRGVYRLADDATVAFDAARRTMAAYLGTSDPNEIVFTGGATAGLNMLASTMGQRLREGDEIVVTVLEHHSNIVPWQMAAQRAGATVKAIPVGDDGRLDLQRLDEIVTSRTRILAATHVSNVTGAVSDTGRLAEAADEVGALFVLDGAQRAAHGPLDVASLGCDAYVFSSHKMFGSTGAGVVWVRRGLLDDLPPFMGGGEMIRRVRIEESSYAAAPHRFEAGTPAIGPVLSMAAAARWLSSLDWSVQLEHELALCERLLRGLADIEGISVLGPGDLQGRYGVVSFWFEDIHAHDVCQLLDRRGVSLRGGHHCAQPLMDRFDTDATARASLAPYSGMDDIEALLDGLYEVVDRLR